MGAGGADTDVARASALTKIERKQNPQKIIRNFTIGDCNVAAAEHTDAN